MRPLSAFLPRVLPYAVGCPDPMALQALLDSAIEFCTKSDVLRQDMDAFDTVVGTKQYDLMYPPQQQVSRLLHVSVGGVRLSPATAETLDDNATENSAPTHFYGDRTDSVLSLFLTPAPDTVAQVVVTVSLCPTRNAVAVQDDLADVWYEPIVAGALSRILRIPSMVFTDMAMANQYRALAAMGTNAARIESSFGRIRGTSVVRSRPFV